MAPKKTTTPKVKKELVMKTNEAPLYDSKGKEVGTVALPATLFGVVWNADLVHQVATSLATNARQTIANTKTRSEVRGGGKKPWKQKGTGRARHGSSRSPIWKGGGVTHGPRKETIYEAKINKKARAKSLAMVLTKKFADGEIIFVDSLKFAAPKTKDAVSMLSAIAKGSGNATLATKQRNAALIAIATPSTEAKKSFRNISRVEVEEVRNLNIMDLLAKKYLIIENPVESLALLSKKFTSTKK